MNKSSNILLILPLTFSKLDRTFMRFNCSSDVGTISNTLYLKHVIQQIYFLKDTSFYIRKTVFDYQITTNITADVNIIDLL